MTVIGDTLSRSDLLLVPKTSQNYPRDGLELTHGIFGRMEI